MYNLLCPCIKNVKKTHMNFTSANSYEISYLIRPVSKD